MEGKHSPEANPNDSGGRHSWEPPQAQYWSLFWGVVLVATMLFLVHRWVQWTECLSVPQTHMLKS